MTDRTYPALFLFAGIGGGALGFQRARADVRGARGRFSVAGAVDIDPDAAADFEQLTGEPCTVGDLATMTPDDVRAACKADPAIVFMSPPCKGFSGCLPAKRAKESHYRDLNALALRSVWITLEAFRDNPPGLILIENVPRIQVRGRALLDQIIGTLQAYGYACRETVHDCGELGGLGQKRRRFLLVARHTRKVGALWFEPPRLPLQSIGDVIGDLPVPHPDNDEGGPMHRLPRLSALNWLRLALVPAGKDWRSLPESVALPARKGRQNGPWGVNDWTNPGHTIIGHASPRDAWASVSDPRSECTRREGSIGVKGWGEPSAPVIANGSLHNGPWQVADPRPGGKGPRSTVYGVAGWDGPLGCVTGNPRHDNGTFAVAEPRLSWLRTDVPFEFDVDDKRPLRRPPIIIAADGTWHRPLTTLELAALQGFPVRDAEGNWLVLGGTRERDWRMRIGNAVPPPTAEAIGASALRALVAADEDVWELGSTPVWVDPRPGAEPFTLHA